MRILGQLLHITATPSFWGTVIGGLLAWFGHTMAGAMFLIPVGFGGCGIALSMGVTAGRDPWRVDTVLEAIVQALRLRRRRCLFGLITHLPQALAGLWLLAGSS